MMLKSALSLVTWVSGKHILRSVSFSVALLSLSTFIRHVLPPTHGIHGNIVEPPKTLSDEEISRQMLEISSAPELTRSLQRRAAALISEISGPARKAFIFDLGNFENKGDPALALGQLYALYMVGMDILFACDTFCKSDKFSYAKELAKNYSTEELVIFTSGGGNLGGYPYNDGIRGRLLKAFPNNKVVILSQSAWFHTGEAHLKEVQRGFSQHPDLHILLRDNTSYTFCKEHFTDSKVHLAPDMAFGIGPVKNFSPPIYDVVWIKRPDGESPGKYEVSFPDDITYSVGDWFTSKWNSPKGNDTLDHLLLKTYTGFLFIQRGNVLVSDRLHGHILATLLNKPTVIIDNRIKKITSLRNVWTAGLEKVLLASDAEDAAQKAQYLLQKYY